MRKDFPYLKIEPDGRVYVRRFGHKIRIETPRGTPEFAAAYTDALAKLTDTTGRAIKTKHSIAAKNTLGWLASKYFVSDEFVALDPISQRTRRGIIEDCLREPVKPGAAAIIRNCPISKFTAKAMKMLMGRKTKKGLLGAANNRRKWISAMFGWAVNQEDLPVTSNPARDARRNNYQSDGFYTWTIEDVAKYEAHWSIGTKPRLALAMLLYLGPRKSDFVHFGRQHVTGQWLKFTPRKTRKSSTVTVEIPILPVLADVIARSPCGDLTFLVTAHGVPFTANGFGNWFRNQCDAAGLPQCTAHGLRKAAASIAAENGATEYQLMAIFGWTTPAQAGKYIAKARRKKMAGAGMALIRMESTK